MSEGIEAPVRVALIRGGVVEQVTEALPSDLHLVVGFDAAIPHPAVNVGWVVVSGELVPPPSPPDPPPDPEAIRLEIGRWLDRVPQAKGYDSIVSCASYATSANDEFRADAAAAVAWRDAVWAACFALLADPPDGVATADQVIALLPQPEAFGWVHRDPIPIP